MIIEEDESDGNEAGEYIVEIDEENLSDEAYHHGGDDERRPLKKRRLRRHRAGLPRSNAQAAPPDQRWTSERARLYSCAQCSEAYTRQHHLGRHLVRMHLDAQDRQELDERLTCLECAAVIGRPDYLMKHYKLHHPERPEMDWQELKVYFDDTVSSLLKRNAEDLKAADRNSDIPDSNESGSEDDRAKADKIIGSIPFATKKTRWTSHWPRSGAHRVAERADEHDPDRVWDEDVAAPTVQFEHSSVFQQADAPFLPAPPQDHSDEEFVFEEDDDAGPRPDVIFFQNIVNDLDPSTPLKTPGSSKLTRPRSQTPSVGMQRPRVARRSRSATTPSTATIPQRTAKPRLHHPPAVNKPADSLTLTLAESRSGRGMRIATGKFTKFEALVQVFAKSADLDPEHLSFYHRGQLVAREKTPSTLRMRDGDMVFFDVRTDLAPNGDLTVQPRTPLV